MTNLVATDAQTCTGHPKIDANHHLGFRNTVHNCWFKHVQIALKPRGRLRKGTYEWDSLGCLRLRRGWGSQLYDYLCGCSRGYLDCSVIQQGLSHLSKPAKCLIIGVNGAAVKGMLHVSAYEKAYFGLSRMTDAVQVAADLSQLPPILRPENFQLSICSNESLPGTTSVPV